jgi:predicted O-methyltransferase YrrM
MDFIDKRIQDYCEQHTTPETEVLSKLNRDTHANVLQPRMLSGHLQGRLLAMLSAMIRPTSILEIGTYTGYSAICLAEGLREGGKLITIDVNPELEDRIRKYIEEAGLSESITFIVGDAKTIVRTLPNRYDLVFIDADKASYPLYYELALERLLPGGYIIFDNVLWSGKVLDASQLAKDAETKILHGLNEQIQHDKRVENVLLPVRDGLMILRKN